uniref:hypothetical protein n=1 Tax=Agathobacter sp. TaxID=2021311 RepID=UPI004056F22E
MLTIKAPIELKCNTAIGPSWEAFYHRITGNYEMMSSGIAKEDLLHMVTAPPEVYLAEGGMTSLVQNTQVQNRQETKMEIINNLMNRIVIMEDANLTYQDRVYITDVLKRLGVQNVQQFMHEVNRLKEETQNTEQMIRLYWNYLEEHMQLWEEHHTQEAQNFSFTENQQQIRINLHETIMNRLQTGAVYQILDNFYSNYNGSHYYVSEQAFQITEQKRTAAKLLLNRLTNEIKGGRNPLVYRHENHYENLDLTEEMLNEEAVNNQISSAVLLNLMDNLFLNRLEKRVSHQENWVHAENILYQTAENTLWRLQNQVSNQGFWQSHMANIQQDMRIMENIEENVQPPIVHSEYSADLIEQLHAINQQNIENYHQYQKMIQNYQQEHKKSKENTAEKMRRESLMALSNPQQLLEAYREEAKEQERQEAVKLQEMTKLLPEQTRKIYEQIEHYQSREKQQNMGDITRNNIAMLLQDIQQTENPEMEQILHEQTKEYRNITLLHEKGEEAEGETEESRNLSLTVREKMEQDLRNLMQNIQKIELHHTQDGKISEEQINRFHEVSQSLLEQWKEYMVSPLEMEKHFNTKTVTEIPGQEIEHLISEIEQIGYQAKTEVSAQQIKKIKKLSEEVLEHWQKNRTNEQILQEKTKEYQTIALLHKAEEEQLEGAEEEHQSSSPSIHQKIEQNLKNLVNNIQMTEQHHAQESQFSEEQINRFRELSQSLLEGWKEYTVSLSEMEEYSKRETVAEIPHQEIEYLISEIEQMGYQAKTEVSAQQIKKVKKLSEEVLEHWQKNRVSEQVLQEKTKEYQTIALLHKAEEEQLEGAEEEHQSSSPSIHQKIEQNLKNLVNNIQTTEQHHTQESQFSEEQINRFYELSRSLLERWKEYTIFPLEIEKHSKTETVTDVTQQEMQHLISEIQHIEEQTKTQVSAEQMKKVKELSEEVLERWYGKRMLEHVQQEKTKQYTESITLLHQKNQTQIEEDLKEHSVERIQWETEQPEENISHLQNETRIELPLQSSQKQKDIPGEVPAYWQNHPIQKTLYSDPKFLEKQEHLLHTISNTESEEMQTMQLSEKHTKQVQEVSKEVLKRWKEHDVKRPRTEHQMERTYNNLSFIHKSQESQLDEEMVEQLFEQSRMLKNSTKVTNHIEENKQVTNTIISNQTQQNLVKENQNLTEMVQRSVQKQIGNISDQVYSKLEKRLQNEKKRRGY